VLEPFLLFVELHIISNRGFSGCDTSEAQRAESIKKV
jgi:hypothetical protein